MIPGLLNRRKHSYASRSARLAVSRSTAWKKSCSRSRIARGNRIAKDSVRNRKEKQISGHATTHARLTETPNISLSTPRGLSSVEQSTESEYSADQRTRDVPVRENNSKEPSVHGGDDVSSSSTSKRNGSIADDDIQQNSEDNQQSQNTHHGSSTVDNSKKNGYNQNQYSNLEIEHSSEDSLSDSLNDEELGVTTRRQTLLDQPQSTKRLVLQGSASSEQFETEPFQFEKTSLGDILKYQTPLLDELRDHRMSLQRFPLDQHSRRIATVREASKNRREVPTYLELTDEQVLQRNWTVYLASLSKRQPNFFTTDEAKLKQTAKVRRGVAAYSGLNVSHDNNLDIRDVYSMCYEQKVLSGASDGAYQQFCTAIGQLLRLSVVCGTSEASQLYKSGISFTAICDLQLNKAFLNYFDIRGSTCTVMTKAAHIKKMLYYAKLYFQREGTNELVGRAQHIYEYVTSVFNAKKRLSRRLASRKKCIDKRIICGNILLPNDFSNCLQISNSALRGIRGTYDAKLEKLQTEGLSNIDAETRMIEILSQKEKFIQKWCINFIGKIILCAGGQRPQVFVQLQAPLPDMLDEFRRVGEEKGFLEIPVLNEKTLRSLNLPHVILPTTLFDDINFHVRIIRAVVLKLSKKDINGSYVGQSEGFCGPLLFDSRNGCVLSVSQLRATFKRFIYGYDSNLASLSLMSIRASYATYMFFGYRQGKVMPEKSEQEFLKIMSATMNTSIEQLKTVYIGVDSGFYDDSARELVSSFCEMVGTDTAIEDSDDDMENSNLLHGPSSDNVFQDLHEARHSNSSNLSRSYSSLID